MKYLATLLIITTAALCFIYPITVDLVGTDGQSAYADSAFCAVLASGDTLLGWTSMDTIGRSATYAFAFPDSIIFATAIVAGFWEDSLVDTTAFTIPIAANPNLFRSMIAETLALAHGTASWESKAILPFLLTMDEDEFAVTFSGGTSRQIIAYRGDNKTVDIYILGASGDTVDITDAEAVFTARTRESDSIAVIVDTLDIVEGTSGHARLELSQEQTTLIPKSYAADIQLTFPEGDVITIWRNRFIVRWDVTR
ncbi:hypothetical protein KAH81_04670 [bacterium]|nr:hypothetical protein [bacterium]